MEKAINGENPLKKEVRGKVLLDEHEKKV